MSPSSQQIDDQILQHAVETLKSESQSLLDAADQLDGSFLAAVEVLLNCGGKVVVTGLGKSGHVARKIAATLASTGSPAFFLHPSEALHGDLGMISPSDCLLAIAHGGETKEVVEVAKFAKRRELAIVSIVGNLQSTLAQLSDHILSSRVTEEACPLNLAPTNSSTLALALGDALAVSLMHARGFAKEDFAKLHPGGSLGRRLALVKDHMRTNGRSVGAQDSFQDVLEALTDPNYGIVTVVDERQELMGVITDGDLRRGLSKFGNDIVGASATQLMNAKPKLIDPQALALEAIQLMEESKITSLLVVDGADPKQPKGLIRMHDLLEAKIV